jgi:hypothetical protein
LGGTSKSAFWLSVYEYTPKLSITARDATPGVPEAPEHKREHFETMPFAIRLQFGQQRGLRNHPA